MKATEFQPRIGLGVEAGNGQEPPASDSSEASRTVPPKDPERLRALLHGLGEDWFSAAVRNAREQLDIAGRRIERFRERGNGKGS